MEKKSVLYIVMPAYNEAKNIRQVIRDWYPIVEKFGNADSRLVIFNDGSKDETFSIMLDEKKNRPLFEPITKPNSGHGATVLAAYHYAIDKINLGGGMALSFKRIRTDKLCLPSLKSFGSSEILLI